MREIRNGRCGWKIICPIREPVSRAISAFFEKYSPQSEAKRGPLGENLLYKKKYTEDTEELFKEFSKNPNFYHGEQWFDDHIKKYFGIDVFAYDFNKDSGWGIIRDKRADILIIQKEKLPLIGKDVIANFLNPSPNSLVLPQIRQTKNRHPKTLSILERKIAENYLEELKMVYGGKYAKHFYSQPDINKFINKWVTIKYEKR